jgi:hypothetical protein
MPGQKSERRHLDRVLTLIEEKRTASKREVTVTSSADSRHLQIVERPISL